MKSTFQVIIAGSIAEFNYIRRSYWIIILTMILAITFLFLVSLFALTGSLAPTAIVTNDNGQYANAFINQLEDTHHSFNIQKMSKNEATSALDTGRIVAIITIPNNFSSSLAQDRPVNLNVKVDNVNVDFTDDIQRAIPSAIVAFGKKYGFYGITVQSEEYDLVDHDTSYISYLVISGLALDTFIISGILGGILIAKEFEKKTIKLLSQAPIYPLISLSGKILISWMISFIAMLMITVIVIFGFKITPVYPILLLPIILISTLIFTCIGLAIGSTLKKVLPVASIIFGLSIPLYIISGAIEPERFDGNVLWAIGHMTPVYYATAIFEYIFHGYQITPEPITVDFMNLVIWALLAIWLTIILLNKEIKK